MKNKKIAIILIIVVILAVLVSLGIYLAIRTSNINKYTIADEYEVKGVKIASVKSVLGEKKVTNYSYKKNTTEILELEFEDTDKEQSAKKYLDYIKDNGNYIEMEVKEENKRQIASPDSDITTVQTEITEKGFKVTIEVGPGKMEMNYAE